MRLATPTRVSSFSEAQESGLVDYFTSCPRANIESLRFMAGFHRETAGFLRLVGKTFPHGIFCTFRGDEATILAVMDLRHDPEWIANRPNKR